MNPAKLVRWSLVALFVCANAAISAGCGTIGKPGSNHSDGGANGDGGGGGGGGCSGICNSDGSTSKFTYKWFCTGTFGTATSTMGSNTIKATPDYRCLGGTDTTACPNGVNGPVAGMKYFDAHLTPDGTGDWLGPTPLDFFFCYAPTGDSKATVTDCEKHPGSPSIDVSNLEIYGLYITYTDKMGQTQRAHTGIGTGPNYPGRKPGGNGSLWVCSECDLVDPNAISPDDEVRASFVMGFGADSVPAYDDSNNLLGTCSMGGSLTLAWCSGGSC